MRTVTTSIYTFSELSESAKNKVRESYSESLEPFMFTEYCECYLDSLLPNSDLKVEYDLSYSQGDYFTILGEADLSDVLAKISDNYTDKELKYLRWFIKEWIGSVEISRGCYYGSDYFYRSKIDFAEKETEEYLLDLCNQLEKDGYKFFYEYSEEDVTQYYEERGYHFLLDGTLVQDWWTE